jgi:hypothetical protein
MPERKWIPVALVLLLMGAWLAAPGRAAEVVGPRTEAAPSSCSATPAIFSLPSSLIPPEGKLASDPATLCGCGDDACVGQEVGSSCPSPTTRPKFCFSVGLCPVTPGGPKCSCLFPP